MVQLLIVDDERWIVTGIQALIQRIFPGVFQIFCAFNGQDAVQIGLNQEIDVIISDVKMPRMGGLDMAGELRRQGIKSHIIFISGYDDFPLVQKALQLHSVDYILKPVREEELLGALRRCLELEEQKEFLDLPCTHPCITTAIEYIEKHYTEDITLDEVADFCSLTPVYFSRLFRKCTGKNYIHLVTFLRVEKAKQLLRNTNHKVYEVGSQVGYGDYRHFTKIFKQLCGLSPSEYRQQACAKQCIRD